MKILKTLLAVLFSFALVWTQAVSGLEVEKTSVKTQRCGCCACKKMDCCTAQPSSQSIPAPAAPLRTATQNQIQLVAVTISILSKSPALLVAKTVPPPSRLQKTIDVPVYQRTCSYLI